MFRVIISSALFSVVGLVGCSSSATLASRWQQLGEPDARCLVAGAVAGTNQPAAREALPTVYAARPEVMSSLRGQTLVHFDCDGNPVAALATEWRWDSEYGALLFRGPKLSTADKSQWTDARLDSIVDREGHTAMYTSAPELPESNVPDFLGTIRFVDKSKVASQSTNLDERDLLETGLDVLVTRNPDVLEYVRQVGTWSAAPLPWNETYSVVAPGGIVGTTSQELSRLVVGAVRSDVRPTAASDDSCSAQSTTRSLLPRVVFRNDDYVGQDIASRLVSLVARGTLRPGGLGATEVDQISAYGVDRSEFEQLRAAARDVLYVESVFDSAQPAAPCHAVLQARSHVVVKPEGPAVVVDAFGMAVVLSLLGEGP